MKRMFRLSKEKIKSYGYSAIGKILKIEENGTVTYKVLYINKDICDLKIGMVTSFNYKNCKNHKDYEFINADELMVELL